MKANSGLALTSLVCSSAGAVLLLSVIAGVWNYSVAGTWFLASGILGIVGAVVGWLDRRQGAGPFNTYGLGLGAAVVVGFGAFSLWLS